MRKHAKDSGGDGGGGVEVETLEDGADGEISCRLLSYCPSVLALKVSYPRQVDHESTKDYD